DPEAAFVYSDYRIIGRLEVPYVNPTGDQHPGDWSPERLRRGNYIDVTSLIRRDWFFGFDPDISRFQDWDLWLTMLTAGCHGRYVREVLFHKHVIDQGITSTVPEDKALEAIRRKHDL